MPGKARYKLWFNLLIYISLGFLLYYLYKENYFSFRNLHFRLPYLFVSLAFLFGGFIISPLAWQKLLTKHQIAAPYKTAIISEGLAIFSKYIPGKIMIIIGRAAYISLQGQSLKITGTVSFKAQLISLLAALSLGIISLLFLNDVGLYLLICFSFVALLFCALFIKQIHELILKMIRKLPGLNFDLPYVTIKESFSTYVYYLILWILWGMAFYFFCLSLKQDVPLTLIPVFPLATALGIVAIIFPGGIGIREGALAFLLIKNGLSPEIAGLISVSSRIWYLSGEVFIFIAALILKNLHVHKAQNVH